MATNVTQSTFLSQYNDDYRDSDHYHRILVNNGRALQARELTQMQTIIQNELGRMASYIFKEAGMFATSFGSINSGVDAIGFVKVDNLPTGYALLRGLDITNGDGIVGTVKSVIPAANGDPDTIFIKYVSTNGLQSINTSEAGRQFSAGDTLSFDDGAGFSGSLTVQLTNTSVNPATGKGSYVEVPKYNTFVAGHLILVEAQDYVLSKYDPYPTAIVGFKLIEEIITASDNIALYDNSGTTPNLTSPGADRYRITMVLTSEADVDDGETFYPLYDIRNGTAISLRSADNALNELGTLMAARTADQLGDFALTSAEAGTFELSIDEDSESGYLLYKVEGGIAFIGGNRIERQRPEIVRVEKARNIPQDLFTKRNEFVSATYGNYVVADSAHGLIGSIANLSSVNLYAGANRTGGVVGTARIRCIDEYDNQFRIHLFDTGFDSNGTGTDYGIRNVRSVGTSSTNYADLAPVKGKYDLFARETAQLLFPLPRTRAHEVTSVTAAIGKVYTATAVSGEAIFSTGTDNIFADQEQWIVSNDASGTLISPPTVSGTPNTSATLTGLTDGATTLFAYENQTLERKTKTLVTNRTQTLSLVSGAFKLNRADIYLFKSVTDAATGADITTRFTFDNGQRDNYYTVGGGRLRSGSATPTGNIIVKYDYFSHSTPVSSSGYFAGKASYPDIPYEDIPIYATNNGMEYRLSDVIDMRPLKNTSGTGFTGTLSRIEYVPRNTDTITIGTVKYWESRIDVVTLGGDNVLNIYSGDTERSSSMPSGIPDDEMKLHQIELNPYTVSNDDLSVTTYDNRGYKMEDIRTLEDRIENLEELTALTMSELSANDITVEDPDDPSLPDRVKLGITGDTFKYNNQSDITSDDYRAMLNKSSEMLMPLNYKSVMSLSYNDAESTHTTQHLGWIWPDFTEEVMINQRTVSKAINVASFEPSRVIGSGVIEPDADVWTLRKKVDPAYQSPKNSSSSAAGIKVICLRGSLFEHNREEIMGGAPRRTGAGFLGGFIKFGKKKV